MNLKQKLAERFWRFYRLPSRIETLQESLGRIESRLNQIASPIAPALPADVEFKVYSQWGEDGIIDYLVRSIPIPCPVFVEFGVETYVEANTLFLLKHRQWRGLVIDGSSLNIETIRRGPVFWRYDLDAVCAFITAENIDGLIASSGITGDIGLLSVDIDGNDYWVWKAIQCVNPRIVVAEYNSLFGPTAKISIPYDPSFYRTTAHPSNMYYGASIAALEHLGQQRGYSIVCGNSAGNNVFFVRNDCLGPLKARSAAKVYAQAGFREARDPTGRVVLTTFAERQKAIAHLPVTDVESATVAKLQEFIA